MESSNNRSLTIFLAIVSALASFIVSIYSGYLSILQNWWFILIAVHFAIEGIFIIASGIIKEPYKAMRVQGIFQVVSVIIMMDYLLVMILWNDPGTMVFLYSYYVFGGAILIKSITTLIAFIAVRKNYNACVHAFRNNDLISVLYLLLLIQLIIFKNFYPKTSLIEQSTIFIYIIEIITNALLTTLGAFLALSTIIFSKERVELSPIGKIKYTIRWFIDNEVSVYFGTLFTIYLAFLAFANQKPIFIYLGAFYLALAAVRFTNYVWHKRIQKRANGNIIQENRESSWILLFDALALFVLGLIVTYAVVALISGRLESHTNIYFFLFFLAPFAVLRFIIAYLNLKRSRISGDIYHIAVGYLALISALFSSVEIFAILIQPLPSDIRLSLVIVVVIVAQVALQVLCVVLIIRFFKGRIQNRRSKEKRLLKR